VVLTGAVPASESALASRLAINGVTRVKWVFEPWGQRPVAEYATVRGNLAVAAGIAMGPPLRSATWHDASGRVLGSFSDGYSIDRQNRFQARVKAALDASRRRVVAPALRRSFTIGRLPDSQEFRHPARPGPAVRTTFVAHGRTDLWKKVRCSRHYVQALPGVQQMLEHEHLTAPAGGDPVLGHRAHAQSFHFLAHHLRLSGGST
jgi:hypothetical protein